MIRRVLAALLALSLTACGPATTPGSGDLARNEARAEAPAAFNQCSICHTTTPGKHLIGPSLAGVYGGPAASASGYPYSTALKQARLTWDDAALDRYLEAPRQAVPGTRMTYAGLKDPAARAQIIAFMKTL